MLDKKNKFELNRCMEAIEEWFCYDTIILLDCVLTDDPMDPEYSANTAYSRLKEVVNFHKLYYRKKYRDVEDYLLQNGYSEKDVELLNQKRVDENRRHNNNT